MNGRVLFTVLMVLGECFYMIASAMVGTTTFALAMHMLWMFIWAVLAGWSWKRDPIDQILKELTRS